MIDCCGKLDAAARHVGMLGFGGDEGGRRNLLRCFAHRHTIGGDTAGGNRGLRSRTAFEQAARDQQAIGAFSAGHGCNYTTVMAGLAPVISTIVALVSNRPERPA